MSWIRIDDQMADHPKLVGLGDLAPLALALQVRALCYVARYLTDGRIPEGILPQLLQGFATCRPKSASVSWPEIMCRAGLWERVDGDGYLIHDYLSYNPSRGEVVAGRERQHEARVRGGQVRASAAHRGGNGRFAPAETPAGSQLAAGDELVVPTPAATSSPAPTPTTTTSTAPDGAASRNNGYPEAFERAWAAYPERLGGNSKKDAFKAWSARVKAGATPDELLAGVERYRRYCEATGKVGTELVQQAKRFFGPGEYFREPWSVAKQGPRDSYLTPADIR